MSLAGKVRTATAAVTLQDACWSLPFVVYRLSGRRFAPSKELYRAGIPWQRIQYQRLPGLTSASERAYFKWHAQEIFSGRGAIADLGSWLGSTTAALAMGLSKNARPHARAGTVHAFDRFVWEPWMEWYAEGIRFGPYAPGDSFLREFECTVAPWRQHVEVHVADLCEHVWDGTPVEVLLVDAMKSWALTSNILPQFFAPLVPGNGHVIHQDFSNCWTPWIHLVSYRLREHLVPVQDVPDSETVVFRLVHTFDDPKNDLNLTRASFEDSEVDEAFAYSLRITRREKHSGIHAAHLVLLVYDGDLTKAEEIFGRLDREGKLNEQHTAAVRDALEEARRRPD
jgi:hypothetical protein